MKKAEKDNGKCFIYSNSPIIKMSSSNDRYILSPNPDNPSEPIKLKILNARRIKGEDYEYELDDGTRITLNLNLKNFSIPIDPNTNEMAYNKMTGEPTINITWEMRVNTVYSKEALDEMDRRRKRNG